MSEPAGWYEDPDDTSLVRYWDGEAWTKYAGPKEDAEPLFPPETQSPATRTPSSSARVDRLRLVVRVAAGVLLLGAVALGFAKPSATYEAVGTPSTAYNSYVTTSACITPWDDWVGRYSHDIPSNDEQAEDLNAASAACFQQIHGRQHIVIALAVIALIVFLLSFLPATRRT